MTTTKHEELQEAVDVFKRSVIDKTINLDFSVESVKHIDFILNSAFENGKLRKSGSALAKHMGVLMLGMSGYVTEVILKHTPNSKLEIDEKDKEWYTNFKVTSEGGWTIHPAQRVIKRAYLGNEAELYSYTISTIKYFNDPQNETAKNTYIQEVYVRDDEPQQQTKKSWWKFWS